MKIRIFQSFKKANWKYVVGEFILVVLGISIALWFSNLNEQKKERDLEHKLLLELRDCLNQDVEDVKGNIELHEKGLSAIFLLYAALSEKNNQPDTLVPYLNNAASWTFLISNSSTYESLKSIGFQIISNDSLRNNINILYNVDYKYIYEIEDRHYENREKLMELFSVLFNYINKRVEIPPNILEQQRMKLITNLTFLHGSHQSLLNQYTSEVLPGLNDLIQQIETEIQ